MLININGSAINTTATGEDVVTIVQNTTNLNQLNDVYTNGINNYDTLQYDISTNEWKNTSVPVFNEIETTDSDGTQIRNTAGYRVLSLASRDDQGYYGRMKIGVFGGALNTDEFGDPAPNNDVVTSMSWLTDNTQLAMRLLVVDPRVDNDPPDPADDGEHSALLYLVGANTEFTSQNKFGDLTPFAFNTSEVLFIEPKNIRYNQGDGSWMIPCADEAGSSNGILTIDNNGAQIRVQDGYWDNSPNTLTRLQLGNNYVNVEADQNLYLAADVHEFRDTSGNAKMIVDNTGERIDTEWPVRFYNTSLTTYTGPANDGMVLFDTDDNKLKVYDGSAWTALH